MQVGVTVPNHWGVEPGQLIELGQLAEELGFASIWTADHLFNAGYIRERLDDKPYYHVLGTLSFLAARTSRVMLGTSVLVLPYHDPIEIAKYVATLDQLSGGRVILGVGAGGMREEFEALGIPMTRRGRMSDEALQLMKELWTSDFPSYESRRWTFSDLRFSPKPLQKPHVPIWIGGGSPGARRRVARLGDGWHPIGLSPEELRTAAAEIRAEAAAAGRDGHAVVMAPRVSVDTDASAEVRPGRIGGTHEEMLAALRAYEAAGAAHVVLSLDSGDPELLSTTMRRIARDLLPALRES